MKITLFNIKNLYKNTDTLVILFLLIIVIILVYVNLNENFTEYFGSSCLDFLPFKTYEYYNKKKDTIFVSIASYRDDECSLTINSIFEKANNPNNIYVGVCQQNKENNENCINPDLIMKYNDNIRTIKMDYKKAKGPTYARYWCSTLWRGEEYFLQIDSHTMFEKDWDINLIKMFKQANEESNRPVLSSYPATKDQIKIDGTPEMCNGKINDGLPVFLAGWTNKSEKPQRSPKPFAAGGFMFLKGEFLYEVPYDPNLSHLFQGEETLFSARLWTHGYDFYTPNIKVASHHYGRHKKPKYWTDHKDSTDCRKKAEKRVLFMLGLEDKKNVLDDFLRDIHKYGLGKVRSLDEYWLASGIDFKNNKIYDDCNNKHNKLDKFKDWNFKINSFKLIKKFD